MKQDVEDVPTRLPRKRQALKRWPDVWIAVWLARDDLDPQDRERLEAVKRERKRSEPQRLGWVRPREGMTPPQKARARELRDALGENVREIHMPDFKATIQESTIVFLFPREMSRTPHSPVWEAERYCRHRKVPTRVVLPNGEEWHVEGGR